MLKNLVNTFVVHFLSILYYTRSNRVVKAGIRCRGIRANRINIDDTGFPFVVIENPTLKKFSLKWPLKNLGLIFWFLIEWYGLNQ